VSQLPDETAEHGRRHDRRYMVFAIILAATILAFAAISITVVVLSA
jgi:hypothetical protein